MDPVTIIAIIDAIQGLIGILERNQESLTPEQRLLLRARTQAMVALAEDPNT